MKKLISYLVYDREWTWLEVLIDILCTIEMQLLPLFDKKFRKLLQTCSLCDEGKDPRIYYLVPHDTFYCHDCIFRNISRVALFFYGNQCCGYCYYLGKGDFNFIRPTELLWDGCKECGLYEDLDIEEFN